jgi:hypothetical protein
MGSLCLSPFLHILCPKLLKAFRLNIILGGDYNRRCKEIFCFGLYLSNIAAMLHEAQYIYV